MSTTPIKSRSNSPNYDLNLCHDQSCLSQDYACLKPDFLDDNELLIRTRLTILSPSYTSSMRSADGMKVYRMPKTPVIMASKDGNTYQLAIQGY